jgi:adenosylcobinamide-phosphate synthase
MLPMPPAMFVAAYALDLLIGDPNWLPHPVRLFGALAAAGERVLRPLTTTPASEFIAGGVLTLAIAGGSGLGCAWLLATLHQHEPRAAAAVWVYLAVTSMATRSLVDEVRKVGQLLSDRKLPQARKQIARIVGRDTDNLDEGEILRAALETAAESSCDGIVAPMFYLAIGGVPAVIAYKAINTLDSIIGHNDERYRYFGKTAARLDDLANLVPARLTALLIVVSAAFWRLDFKGAWRIWRRDAGKHPSPNAGLPEAAMAGALGVRFGGTNFYGGEPFEYSYMGDGNCPATQLDLQRGLKLVMTCSLLMFALALAWCFHSYGRII